MITNQWYAILPSRKVKIGQIVAVKRLNLELALFRNSKGELSCVVDQCSHRGAALSLGKVKNDCIQCPFHGMEFDKDGKCTFIPANGTASTEDLSQFNVKHYTVRERNGIVYLWYIRLCNKLTRFKNLNSFIAYIGKFINRRIASQIRRVVSTQKPVATELNTSENLIQGDAPIIMYRKIREDLKA